MSRIAAVFARRGHTALIPYVTVGYPSVEATLEVVPLLAGCEMCHGDIESFDRGDLQTEVQALMDEAQGNVTGTVRLKLYKGNCIVVGRKSEHSLYHPDFATFEEEKVYDQKDAEGFIRLNALRLKIPRLMKQKQ